MDRTVFANANLLDGERPARPGFSVVVEGDRITGVTEEQVPSLPGDRVIDCVGKTVMPGMVQGHFHSTYQDVHTPLEPPLGLEHPPAYQAYIAAYNARVTLRSGVTSAVGANEAFDIDPSLAIAIADGLVIGPRVIPGSRDLITTADSNDVVPWWWEAQAMGGVRLCDGPDEFRKAARDEIKRGAAIVKLFATGGHGIRLSADISTMTKAELTAAVDAAHNLGKRARAHVASKRGILACLEAGVDVLDHGDGLDEECIQALVETETPLLPSIHGNIRAVEALGDADPDTGFQSPRGRETRAMLDVLPRAAEAGVLICLGDDYGTRKLPHGTYGAELGVFVHYAGIPALEVIRWACVNGAAVVGRNDLGRVAEGFLADLLVIDGDPSADVRILGDVDNVKAVMRDGILFFYDESDFARPQSIAPESVLSISTT